MRYTKVKLFLELVRVPVCKRDVIRVTAEQLLEIVGHDRFVWRRLRRRRVGQATPFFFVDDRLGDDLLQIQGGQLHLGDAEVGADHAHELAHHELLAAEPNDRASGGFQLGAGLVKSQERVGHQLDAHRGQRQTDGEQKKHWSEEVRLARNDVAETDRSQCDEAEEE